MAFGIRLGSRRPGRTQKQDEKPGKVARAPRPTSMVPWLFPRQTSSVTPFKGTVWPTAIEPSDSRSPSPDANTSAAWDSPTRTRGHSSSWRPSWPRLGGSRFSRTEPQFGTPVEAVIHAGATQHCPALASHSPQKNGEEPRPRHAIRAAADDEETEEAFLALLLEGMYEKNLDSEQVSTILFQFPEVRWIAQCVARAPAHPDWHKHQTKPAFICTATGELSETPPDFLHFVHLARLIVRARQNPDQASAVCYSLEALRQDAVRHAEQTPERWTGPYKDRTTGLNFYHSAATGHSTWEHPAAVHLFLAYVLQKVLDDLLPSAALVDPGYPQQAVSCTSQYANTTALGCAPTAPLAQQLPAWPVPQRTLSLSSTAPGPAAAADDTVVSELQLCLVQDNHVDGVGLNLCANSQTAPWPPSPTFGYQQESCQTNTHGDSVSMHGNKCQTIALSALPNIDMGARRTPADWKQQMLEVMQEGWLEHEEWMIGQTPRLHDTDESTLALLDTRYLLEQEALRFGQTPRLHDSDESTLALIDTNYAMCSSIVAASYQSASHQAGLDSDGSGCQPAVTPPRRRRNVSFNPHVSICDDPAADLPSSGTDQPDESGADLTETDHQPGSFQGLRKNCVAGDVTAQQPFSIDIVDANASSTASELELRPEPRRAERHPGKHGYGSQFFTQAHTVVGRVTSITEELEAPSHPNADDSHSLSATGMEASPIVGAAAPLANDSQRMDCHGQQNKHGRRGRAHKHRQREGRNAFQQQGVPVDELSTPPERLVLFDSRTPDPVQPLESILAAHGGNSENEEHYDEVELAATAAELIAEVLDDEEDQLSNRNGAVNSCATAQVLDQGVNGIAQSLVSHSVATAKVKIQCETAQKVAHAQAPSKSVTLIRASTPSLNMGCSIGAIARGKSRTKVGVGKLPVSASLVKLAALPELSSDGNGSVSTNVASASVSGNDSKPKQVGGDSETSEIQTRLGQNISTSPPSSSNVNNSISTLAPLPTTCSSNAFDHTTPAKGASAIHTQNGYASEKKQEADSPCGHVVQSINTSCQTKQSKSATEILQMRIRFGQNLTPSPPSSSNESNSISKLAPLPTACSNNAYDHTTPAKKASTSRTQNGSSSEKRLEADSLCGQVDTLCKAKHSRSATRLQKLLKENGCAVEVAADTQSQTLTDKKAAKCPADGMAPTYPANNLAPRRSSTDTCTARLSTKEEPRIESLGDPLQGKTAASKDEPLQKVLKFLPRPLVNSEALTESTEQAAYPKPDTRNSNGAHGIAKVGVAPSVLAPIPVALN